MLNIIKHRWYPSQGGIKKNSNGHVWRINIINKVGYIVCVVSGSTENDCAETARHIIKIHNSSLIK